MAKGLFHLPADTAEEMRAAVLAHLTRQAEIERAAFGIANGVRALARAQGREDMCRDLLAFFSDLTIRPKDRPAELASGVRGEPQR